MVVAIYDKLSVNRMGAIFVILAAILVKMVLVSIITAINAEPLDAHPIYNLIFLMFQRPVFVISGALAFTPILLRNPFTLPITQLLEHSFWFPLARLSYGAYLCAGVFMLYRTYNMERGLWACELDSFFLFMAYLSFAFLFSFLITVFVELPCQNLFMEFIVGRSNIAAASYQRGFSKAGSRISDDDSDVETLDSVVVDDPQKAQAALFVSNSSTATSYKQLAQERHKRQKAAE